MQQPSWSCRMVCVCTFRQAAEFAAADEQQVRNVAETTSHPAVQQVEPQAGETDMDVCCIFC